MAQRMFGRSQSERRQAGIDLEVVPVSSSPGYSKPLTDVSLAMSHASLWLWRAVLLHLGVRVDVVRSVAAVGTVRVGCLGQGVGRQQLPGRAQFGLRELCPALELLGSNHLG